MFKILRFAVVHNKIIFSNSWDSIFFKKNSNLSLKMSQKSIMSFFARASSKPASVTPTKEEKVVDNEDSCSPIKVKNSKRLRIESDSDSDSPPDKRPSIGNGQIKTEILATDVSKEDNLVEMSEENLSEVNIKTETQASPKSNGKIDCEQNQTSPSSETNKKDEISPKGKKKEEKTPKSKKKEEKTPKSKKKEEKTPKSKKKEEKTPKSIKNEEITPKSKKNEKTLKSEKDSPIVKEENESKDVSKNVKQNEEIKEENTSTEEKENSKQQSKPPPGKGINSFFTSKTTAKKDDVKTTSGYDPSKLKYHPIEDAVWSRGEKVPYLSLARTLEEIEKISARLRIVELLSNFFRSVIILSPNDLLPSVYLCLNKLAPAYENVELGIAETTLMKAIAQTTGRSMAQIKNDCNSTGDIGLVAEQSKSNQRMMFQPAPLTVKGVFDKLKDIAQMSGQASMAKKVDKIQSMFVACRFSEARFLIRSLAGKLRIGLAEQSVLQALAQACTTTPPLLTQQDDSESWPPKILNASKGMSAEQFKGVVDEQALILKTIYCECPNYNMIIPILLEHGIKGLPEHCRLTPGIPLKPMLAHPTKGVQEVLQRFENVEFTCEWKYDGERAQIHVPSIEKDGKATYNISRASVYSRNQENNTTKYPDIINRLEKTLKDTVTSCILDCEAVAWDKEKNTIMPFQVLSTRKKKDANESEIKVAVCIFMFDLLYLNGESLVKKPFEERRRLLRDHFKTVEGEWHMATSLDCSTIESIQEFLEESVKGNCEGLMVKTLNGKDATYEIAKRSRNWLKLKKDYLEGVGDTIDAVVIGGYLGRGKRTGVYGGFLLACYDKDTDEYQTLCKIGTGFSDQDLQEHSKSLTEHVIPNPKSYYRYDSSLEPDHWFDAVKVWEVKCADLSLSPIHRAAMGAVDPDKGISLRFPRFIRIRDDKTAENATSARQIAELYCNQDQVKNQASNNPKNVEEDFY